jgi:hypothetical protein
MDRYVLVQNIQRFQLLLGQETDDGQRAVLARMLLQSERELALLSAQRDGVDVPAARRTMTRIAGALELYLQQFKDKLLRSERLLLVIDAGPGLPIIDASEAYVAATMTRRVDLIGCNLFEVFPDNPDDPSADGVAHLYASLRTAAASAKPHRMPVQKYDVRDGHGVFQERYWQPVNSPVLDDAQRLIALLHEVADVTDSVKASR